MKGLFVCSRTIGSVYDTSESEMIVIIGDGEAEDIEQEAIRSMTMEE